MITLRIFSCLPARTLLLKAESFVADESLYTLLHGRGVYFHVYQNADRPFYIGISEDMLQRNIDHLEGYQNKKYWLVKNPHRLLDLRCFVNDAYYSTFDFFAPKRDNQRDPAWSQAIHQLMEQTNILFAHVELDGQPASRIVVEEVERQLQDNLIERLNLWPDWVGRTGSNRGGGLDGATHAIKLEFAPSILCRLNPALLV